MTQKIIWMQLLLIGILSSFQSCKKTDNAFIENYVFINSTGYQIEIEAYNRIDNGYYKTAYYLPNDSSLYQEIDISFGSITGIIAHSDSVSLKFGNSKIIGFVPTTNSPYNILDHSNYDLIKIDENHYEYTFEFNEEMYNSANTGYLVGENRMVLKYTATK
jgi:hypothetical protein